MSPIDTTRVRASIRSRGSRIIFLDIQKDDQKRKLNIAWHFTKFGIHKSRVMKNATLFALIALIVLLSGCASPEAIQECVDTTQREGFWMGLVQGFIAPITFIISLFTDDVAMYAVNNNGGWYDFGFLLGIGGFSGGILKGRRRSRR